MTNKPDRLSQKPTLKMILKDRLIDKIMFEPNTGCWLFTGYVTNLGYGSLAGWKSILAHRVSYWIHKGNIPKGKEVCHVCDVRCCVNPDHLFLGTHKENMHDCFRKGRGYNAVVKPKLTRDNVMEIHELYRSGTKQKDIATHFNVGRPIINQIIKGTRRSVF